ncbi:MAG: oligosaccharide flippase family protein [Mariniphaga sp.]|nr:oligosaccharide flippase family protein [Mariniphaga sp.]
MTGTAIAQIIGFLLMPVVSRLYTSSDFGVYGSFISLSGITASIATFQYSQAIMLPKKKKDAFNLFFMSCLSAVLVTFLVVIIIVLFPTSLQKLIKIPSAWLLILLPIATLISGLNQSLQAWSVRAKAFKHTASSQIIRTISSSGVWLLAGLKNAGFAGLIAGSVMGGILASINLIKVLYRDFKTFWISVSWANFRNLALEFRNFPFFAAPQNLLNAVSQGLPVLLLGHFYGIEIAGFYAFGMRLLMTPTGFVLKAMRQVLFQKASEIYNRGINLSGYFLKTTGVLVALAIIPGLILFIWSPQIFSFVFGQEWWEAGIYSRWLILWVFMMFCNVPSILFAKILRQQKNLFLFECLVLSTRMAVLVVGGAYWTALNTVIVFSILGLILNLFLILWVGILLFKQKKALLVQQISVNKVNYFD